MLYVAAQSLNIDIIAISRRVVTVAMIWFKYLSLYIALIVCSRSWTRILPEVIKTQRCSADASPWKVRNFPQLATLEKLPAPLLRTLVSHIPPKVGTHEIVRWRDDIFMEKEPSRSIGILAKLWGVTLEYNLRRPSI